MLFNIYCFMIVEKVSVLTSGWSTIHIFIFCFFIRHFLFFNSFKNKTVKQVSLTARMVPFRCK